MLQSKQNTAAITGKNVLSNYSQKRGRKEREQPETTDRMVIYAIANIKTGYPDQFLT